MVAPTAVANFPIWLSEGHNMKYRIIACCQYFKKKTKKTISHGAKFKPFKKETESTFLFSLFKYKFRISASQASGPTHCRWSWFDQWMIS